jgi:hypothetical protein
MHRALVTLVFVLAAGCHGASQPDTIEVPRQENAPKVQQSGPEAGPPVLGNQVSPPDEVPKSALDSNPGRIDAAQAVKIAEQFVRDNGYTDYIPPDTNKLVPESYERLGREDWIARRRNTLRPLALGYFEGARRDPSGWTVGFEYVEPSDRGLGRAVTMDERGGLLRMQHQDLRLKFLRPRPE